MTQKTLDDINPYIGFENGFLIGRNGEYTLGFKVLFPPVFTTAPEIKQQIFTAFADGINILPNYTRIHRQDFINYEKVDLSTLHYNNFFEKEYMETYSNKEIQTIHSYIYFTIIPKNFHDASIIKFSTFEKMSFSKIPNNDLQDFQEKVSQFINYVTAININNIQIVKFLPLTLNDYIAPVNNKHESVASKLLFLNHPYYSDIIYDRKERQLKIGNERVEIISLSTLEQAPSAMKQQMEYSKYTANSEQDISLSLSWGGSITLIPRFNHIVNSYIIKGDTIKEINRLETKRNWMQSLRNTDPLENIELFLQEVQSKKASIVNCHMNIIIWDEDKEKLVEKRETICTTLNSMGCANAKIESQNTFNLFIASLAGNCINIFNEYRFKTIDRVGAAFLNYDGLYSVDQDKQKLRLIDRFSGSPIRVDLCEPYRRRLIGNKNKFVLGGSGSGKSFTMNHYLYHKRMCGATILIVDVGRSYEGICNALGGKWIESTEDKPLSFNPFILSEFDWNEKNKRLSNQKAQTLIAIIKVLWRGVDDDKFEQTENVIVQNLLDAYYLQKISPRNFNTFYEFAQTYEYPAEVDFNKEKFILNLSPYYGNGPYANLLNAEENVSLVNETFTIFELDSIKGNKILFAITAAMIMDTYISQMYNQAGEKVIVFEEAWQAISNAEMSENIKYLAKTGRKYNSELIIVTQELNDIIANEIVGQALINNCDTKILLDQSKFSENFDFIKKFLGLNHFQICQVLSLNKGKDPRNKSKDFFICYANGMSDVYEVGVSQAEALLYASDKPIKDGIKKVAHHFNINYCDAIKYIIENMMKDIEQYQHKHPCDFDNAVNIILDNHEKGSHIFNHAG